LTNSLSQTQKATDACLLVAFEAVTLGEVFTEDQGGPLAQAHGTQGAEAVAGGQHAWLYR